MVRKISAVSCFLLFTCLAFCQTDVSQDFRFLKHLEKLEEWDEGLLFLDQIDSRSFSGDTMNFFRGKFQYKLRKSTRSIASFQQVSKNNWEYFRYARFFGAFQSAYTGDLSGSYALLSEYEPRDSSMTRLKNLQIAGIDLLKRDFSGYLEKQKEFTYAYDLEPYERGIVERYGQLKDFKRKSPFTAALLSTVIPGAGRFYIGNPGQGVAGLLVTSIFGLQALEGYRKDGVNSVRFILFGSLFSISHIANIWGTALAVRIRRDEFNDQINDSILLDMHIPLRVLLD